MNTEFAIKQPRYSEWHREELSEDCFAFDIDMLEIRDGKVKAIFELAEFDHPPATKLSIDECLFRRKFQIKITTEIARNLNTKYYFVAHDADMTYFYAINMMTGQHKEMDDKEYKSFIENI